MSKSEIHTVILHPQYTKENLAWLQRFVFQNQENTIHVFSCQHIEEYLPGMTKFQRVMMKANGEKEDILLPSHVIVGVLLDQSHKNQFGFFLQGQSLE